MAGRLDHSVPYVDPTLNEYHKTSTTKEMMDKRVSEVKLQMEKGVGRHVEGTPPAVVAPTTPDEG